MDLHLDESNGTAAANTEITNIKEFGWRVNSDGVDIDSSQYVTLSNSYIRTFDDLVAIKTAHTSSADTVSNVIVTGMTLWNQKAHALTVGTEIEQLVNGVTFEDSDIIHDTGHDWLLAVNNAEAGTAENITFNTIRIGQVEGLMAIAMPWTTGSVDPTPGNINNITFTNISSPTVPTSVPQPACPTNSNTCTAGTARSPNPPVSLAGYGPYDGTTYEVNTVTLSNDTINGSNLTLSQVSSNAYVTGITVTP